jgi:hypothetical protein
MAIKADFITGKQSFGNWAGVYAFVPETGESKEMFVSIRISVESDEFNLENAGKLLLDELQGIYFSDKKAYTDQVSRLENALWKMKGKMDYILSKEQSLMEKGLDIELAVCVYDDTFAYTAVIGESKIKIYRQEKLIDISDALSDAANSGFFKTGSLELDPEDRIFLITSKAANEFPDSEIEVGARLLDFSKLRAKYPETSEGTAAVMIYKDGAQTLPVEEEVVESVSEVSQVQSNEVNPRTPSNRVVGSEIGSEVSEIMSETIEEASTIAVVGEKAKEFSRVAKTNLLKAGNFTVGKLHVLKNKVIEMRNKRNGVEMSDEQEYAENEIEQEQQFNDQTQDGVQSIPQRTVLPEPLSDSRLYDESEEDTLEVQAPVKAAPYPESEPIYDEEGNVVAQYKPFAEESVSESEVESIDSDNAGDVYEDVYDEEEAPVYASNPRTQQLENSGSRFDSVRGRLGNVDKEKISGFLGTVMGLLKKLAAILFELTLKLIELFKKEILGVGENRRDRLSRAKRRRRNRIILVVVLILLFLIISNSIRSAQDARFQQEQLDSARSKVTEFANTHTALDAKISTAKAAGDVAVQNLLADFDRLNAEINVQKRGGLLAEDFTSIQEDIQFSKDELLNITSVTTPQTLVDVGRSYPDANLSDIEYSNGGIFITDQGRDVIYRVGTASLNGVAQSFVTGLTQPYNLVRNLDGDVVFYDNNTTSAMGVFDYESGEVTRFPGLTPSSIGRVTESAMYSGNGSLYEVRNSTTQIFKRDPNGSSFANGGATQSGDFNSNWRVDTDYANAVDVATPYEIYMLIKGQGIKRYFAREANTLTSDLYSNISQSDLAALQNGSSLDAVDTFVAVGDPANKRIFLFRIDDTPEKGLTLMKQYVYRGSDNVFTDIDEILIVPNESSIYVLDNLKVIKLPLQ